MHPLQCFTLFHLDHISTTNHSFSCLCSTTGTCGMFMVKDTVFTLHYVKQYLYPSKYQRIHIIAYTLTISTNHLSLSLSLSQETVNTTISDLSIQVNSTLNCSKGFTVDPNAGYCVPVCGEWSELSQNTAGCFKIISTTLYAIHTLGNVVSLALSCYNYRTMYVHLRLKHSN